MKAIAVVTSAAFLALGSTCALASADLAKSAGCTGCHDVTAKKMGPSFKSIAEKYKGKADAEAKLVAELKEGKKHPAQKAKPEDLTAIVKWALAQ
jgi:cytochrome c551/c552